MNLLDQDITQQIPTISDNCPDWAHELIRKIYLIEIEVGTIPNPTSGQWNTKTQEELLKAASDLEDAIGSDMDQEAEALFGRVARGLINENFSAEEVAAMINARIPTGTKLNYCSPSEVLGSLQA